MILQLRTKDPLDELLKAGNSPAWVIAEHRVAEIEKVEIYQFDGKKVLKADFDDANSIRNEDDRLIVAFKNGIIEDCDFDWEGQNPVHYQSKTNNQKTTELIAEDSCSKILKTITAAYKNNNDNVSDLLNDVSDNNELNYHPPCIYIEWLKDGAENPMDAKIILYSQNLNSLLKVLNNDTSSKILELLKTYEESYDKRNITRGVLYDLIHIIEQAGYKILAAVKPTEWYNALFVYRNEEDILPHYLIHHFTEAKDGAEGWFDEFYQAFEKSLNEYLNDNYSHLDVSDRVLHKYNINDGPFGKTCASNLEILNLNDAFFDIAKKGLLAAKKFC